MNQCNRTAFDKAMNKLYCDFPCPGSCNQIKENYSEPPSGSYSQTISLGEGDEIDRKVCRPGSERLWDNKKIITCSNKKGQRIRVDCNNGFEGNDNGFRCSSPCRNLGPDFRRGNPGTDVVWWDRFGKGLRVRGRKLPRCGGPNPDWFCGKGNGWRELQGIRSLDGIIERRSCPSTSCFNRNQFLCVLPKET